MDFLYIHLCAVGLLPTDQRCAIEDALQKVPTGHPCYPNVAKMNVRTRTVSLLNYPCFGDDSFPELDASWVFGSGPGSVPVLRRYDNVLNPPILHRKELLVPPDYPERAEWEELTRTAESLGLFDDTTVIGFRLNWDRLIASKGYQFANGNFLPLGNEVSADFCETATEASHISRHLTALTRTSLSAPVQLLIRHRLLPPEASFFDYGCGRGGDVAQLREQGQSAHGWDPHYAPDESLHEADAVNLGFVINVIEDAAERVEALQRAFALARGVLAIGVMLHGNDVAGTPYRDGVVTTRRTFQKYYSQGELKDYIEQVLHQPAFMVAPGIAFVFADKQLEQRFSANRYRTKSLADRLLRVRNHPRPARIPAAQRPPRLSRGEQRLLAIKPHLDSLWERSIDLGRWPDRSELANADEFEAVGGLARAVRLLVRDYDMATLESAAQTRRDDVAVYFVNMRFEKRKPYRQLEPRLQFDIKAFFGDYNRAQDAAQALLTDASSDEKLLAACRYAAERGLGWLQDDHSLQVHVDLVDRLPAVLRTYVACGLLLWDSTSDVELVKIHIGSGKLTLLELVDFDSTPLPQLRRRIKINMRKQAYDVFEYGSVAYPMPLLYWKSRYLDVDYPGYAEQFSFDEALAGAGVDAESHLGPSAEHLSGMLAVRRLEVSGFAIVPSTSLPELDAPCGENFTYRSFIACGETQHRTQLPNIPLAASSYNALHALATQVLDPIVEYFGSIKLTYGFCSSELGKYINRRVAPRLDQHACHEVGERGRRICLRDGAACDFIVEDENMEEVATWIATNVPFDRLYIYGSDKPLHVSYGPEQSRSIFHLRAPPAGRLVPVRAKTPEGDGSAASGGIG